MYSTGSVTVQAEERPDDLQDGRILEVQTFAELAAVIGEEAMLEDYRNLCIRAGIAPDEMLY